MAYDSARGRVVLFGGLSGSTRLGDIWEWDGESWTEQNPDAPTPSARHSHAMAYDSARRVVVLFGGNASGREADTWEWDGTAWNSLGVTPAPYSRYGHSMAYDAGRGVVVLFGGYDNQNERLDDTWEWNGGTWTERIDLPPSRPSARAYAAMAYDEQRDVIVLFGGNQGGAEPYCGDTWEYDGNEWTHRTDNGPSAREGAAAAYDATSGRDCVVLFGGYDSTYKQDTWKWDGASWTQESPSNPPSSRYQHAMAYCGKVLLFGGLVGGNENRQTYDYGEDLEPEWACCFADGSCQEMAEAHCLGAGGASWREGETCSSCQCAAPPPQAAYFLGDQPLSGSAAHQVNTATGNFHYDEVDLSIASRRGSFAFARHYNSLDGRSGPLGKGWRHTYHIVLTPPDPPDQTYVAVTWANGRTTFWNEDPPGSGEYKAATRDLYDKIELSGGIWTVTRTSLDQYRFDSSGHLLSILPVGNSNNEISLTYEVGTDLLIKVTDPAGHWLDLGYDDDRLTSVADHTSRSVQFNYTGDLLTSVVDVLGGQIDYEYDGHDYLGKVKDQRDPQITVITNEYAPDGTGRVFHYTDGNGNTTDFLYRDDETEITQTVDGHEITRLHKSEMVYQRQTIDRDPLGHEVVYTYDEDFNRVTMQDRNGNVTNYAYDDLGNVTSVTAPDDPGDPNDGGVTSFEYNDSNLPHLPTRKEDALGYVIEWTYDTHGNMLTEKRYLTVPPGSSFVEKSWTYNEFDQCLTAVDERGNTHQWHYTAEGQLDYTIDREDNYTWYGYDNLWRRIWVTDGRGSGPQDAAHTSRMYYDADDRLKRTESPPVGDPSHLIVQEFGYDEVGNRTSVIDGNGHETEFNYDGNNNLRFTYQPLGRTTEYQYDELNRRVKVIDALYHATDYNYDDADRLTERTDAEDNKWRYTHDDHGNVLTASQPSDSDPTGGITATYEYDALHRRTSVTNELSHVSCTEYDKLGRVTRTIDATDQPTNYEYDGLGRLTAVEDALGGRTEYTYDDVGNLLQILDANGHMISQREYDKLNRLTRAEDGNGNYYTYGYDAVGNQTWVRDANAQPDGPLTTLTYDAVNRRTAMNYQDGTWVTFSYDDNGNRERMTESVDPGIPSLFGYDALNRLTSSVDRYGMRVDYGYDTVGRRTRLVYPGLHPGDPGNELTYGYDAANRLTSITDWADRTTQYTYDGLLVETVTFPNSAVETRDYDDAGRLIDLTTTRDTETVVGFNWTRAATGEPLTATETNTLPTVIPIRVVSYEYDDDNRLTESSKGTYEYDPNGNLTSRTIGGETTDFEYDAEDRLTAQIRDPYGAAIRVDHVYDGDGNRIARADDNGTTRYVLDRGRSMSHVLCEMNTSGNVTAYYIHGPTLVARIDDAGTPRYYHTNDLGNVVALTDAAGVVVDRYAYDPYGLPVNHEGTTPNPFTFVGASGVMTEDVDFDDPAALYFMRARFYDPDTGRFLGKDPLEGVLTNPLGLNRYVYVSANPVFANDPSGLIPSLYDSPAFAEYTQQHMQQYQIQVPETTFGAGYGERPYHVRQYETATPQELQNLGPPGGSLVPGWVPKVAQAGAELAVQLASVFLPIPSTPPGTDVVYVYLQDKIRPVYVTGSEVSAATAPSGTVESRGGRSSGISPLATVQAFKEGIAAKIAKIQAERAAKAAAEAAAARRASGGGGGSRGGGGSNGGGPPSTNHVRNVLRKLFAPINRIRVQHGLPPLF